MDMESLRQDLAAYEAAFAEAREATVRAADAERTRSRRALASGRPSRQGKRAEEKTGAARPSRSRGGESRRSRSPPPSRSRRRGPPILSPLGKGKRRISDGNVSAAPASSSPSGGGAAKAQRRSPGSDAPATIALPYSHMSLHQLSAMANRTGELARKDEMQAQARKDAMQMLVGSGPVMRAVREELRQEQRAHDAQMRAHKAEGRGIHARSGARSPSPPAKRRGGDASPAARGADSGAPRIARARSDVLLDRRRKLLGTAVTRTRRSKKRREEPATQGVCARTLSCRVSQEGEIRPLTRRARVRRRHGIALRGCHAPRLPARAHGAARDSGAAGQRPAAAAVQRGFSAGALLSHACALCTLALTPAGKRLQRGPKTSSSLEKERLQEQLGKRIREECSLCKLTFAGTNLPMVVTHKAINDMRTSWGHPPPQDRFATFPACYDTARVCYFCAQFFETRGPSRVRAAAGRRAYLLALTPPRAQIEASKSQAKKQGFVDSPSQRR